MSFVFAPSPPDLAPWVIGFGERRDLRAFSAMRELPMPSPALQFMMGGDYHLAGVGPAPRAALWGPVVTSSLAWTDAPALVFLIFLTGYGAVTLSGRQLAQLSGRRITLATIDAHADRTLTGPLLKAEDFPARQRVASAWIRRRFESPAGAVPPIVALTDRIVLGTLRAPVTDIARSVGVTPRGLSKAFNREVGCSPKRLLRLARLQRVLQSIHPRPWTGASPEDPFLEYHDQAHLDRDFSDLTGMSRLSYVKAKAKAGDQLIYTVV